MYSRDTGLNRFKRHDGFWIGPFMWVAIWLTVLVVIVEVVAP